MPNIAEQQNRVVGGDKYFNGSADANVATGDGNLIGIFVASSSAASIKIYDNTAASGAVLINTFTAVGGTWYPMPFHFLVGLYIDITGTIDFTVCYSQ